MNILCACTVLVAIGLTAGGGYAATDIKQPATLHSSASHREINKEILEHFEESYYNKVIIDDQFSSKVLYRYLDELDPNHRHFYANDIIEFEIKYKSKLDDSFKNNDLEPAFEIFNSFQQRVIERLAFLIDWLERDLDGMRLDVEESLRVDRKDLHWPGSEIAMKDLWRKQLKDNVIRLKLAGKSPEEAIKTLLRRFNNQLNRVYQNNNDDVFQIYMNSLALSLDPHTQYFSPHRTENFNINMSLSLEGIGAVLQTEDEFTKVLRLIPGGPAERSKLLKAADRIVGVAQGAEGEMLDVVGWRLDEVVNKIRGPKGTLVRLEIIPADTADEHQTKVISIVRDKVKLEEQAAKKKVIEVKRDLNSYKLGVIDIPTFYADFQGMHAGKSDYKSTTKDVQKLVDELKGEGVTGIIIDLRDNGGGSLQEANSLTGLFIGLGPTVQVKNARGRIDIIRDHDPNLSYSGPIIVLLNRMSASASEIFAGAMQDYQRGIIFGEQTFGKGTVQSLLPLSKGQLKLTTAKYYRISGQSTQHKGIVPDLEYPSLYSFEDVGESSLPEALPWDQIKPIAHQTYYKIDDLMLLLKNKHLARTRLSMDYQYLLERRQRNQELREKKEVPLSEKTRRKELEESEKWLLELENTLRLSKGKEPLEKLSDVSGMDNDEEGFVDPHGNDDKDDPLLDEAAEVMVDFINLYKQNVSYR